MSNNVVAHSLRLGEQVLTGRSKAQRKRLGQFLTPAPLARFMARQLGSLSKAYRLLEPAAGSGTLACAVIERAVNEGTTSLLHIEAFEVDSALCIAAEEALYHARVWAAARGVTVEAKVRMQDFTLHHAPVQQPALLTDFTEQENANYLPTSIYDGVIANPPYFKLNRTDPRAQLAWNGIKSHTNIYTLFMALSLEQLRPSGRACFIVPRSFCSGAYFAAFRRYLVDRSVPLAAHLFESRQALFKDGDVLQENVIFTIQTTSVAETAEPRFLKLSASQSLDDLEDVVPRRIPLEMIVKQHNGSPTFRFPLTDLDEQIVAAMDSWRDSFQQQGLSISTGPVVAFRAERLLRHEPNGPNTVPLLWMHNVRPHAIMWPAPARNKPQYLAADVKKLLVSTCNYVLLRRFSAKEEPRRLIAAPFLATGMPAPYVGLENHLNYIYRRRSKLSPTEVHGLSAFLNSGLVDRYFRITSGNTQINATELRELPLPPWEVITRIGARVFNLQTSAEVEYVLFRTLQEAGCLTEDIPFFTETRISMGKIQEAQRILRELGLPPAQQNEMSALTMLVLAQLSEETPWAESKRTSLRIHDVLREIKVRYGREYAENTRETIRRQVIHQFEQAGLVERNPDDPSLATNSPRTHYALSPVFLDTLKQFGTEQWNAAVEAFLQGQGSLLELYRQRRAQHKVPLRLADGEAVFLSPGKHNELQVAVVEEFGPRFAPGARLIYLGDTANKTLIFDTVTFDQLGIQLLSHNKLPDIVLYDEAHNWLILIEIVTSHGPVSPKRYVELQSEFEKSSAKLIFVSAFPNFATFKAFATEIAWETEVWIAELPGHMIHFNGDQFFKPHQ